MTPDQMYQTVSSDWLPKATAEIPISISEVSSALGSVAACANRLAETAGALHAARQYHEDAAKQYAVALDRLAKAREQENL